MFKPTSKSYTASELAERLNAELIGSPDSQATRVTSMDAAGEGASPAEDVLQEDVLKSLLLPVEEGEELANSMYVSDVLTQVSAHILKL